MITNYIILYIIRKKKITMLSYITFYRNIFKNYYFQNNFIKISHLLLKQTM